jgi:hypothetical protein
MSKRIARKKWDTEFNRFVADNNSTWEYKPFKNRKPTMEDIVAIVQKNKLYKNTVRSGKATIYNRCYRTYVYRELVEGKIYDGNSIVYKHKNSTPSGSGNWKDADKAIDEFNKVFADTPMFVQDGVPPRAVGNKPDTAAQMMDKLMIAAGLKEDT